MSYEYLKQEKIIPVALSRGVGRIEERVFELSPGDEKRAPRLHQEAIVIDFHNYLIVLPENLNDFEAWARSGRPPIGYESIKRSGMKACLCGLAVPWEDAFRPHRGSSKVWSGISACGRPIWIITRMWFGVTVFRIFSMSRRREKWLLFLTSAGAIGNDIGRLDALYGLGIRCMGLSFNNRAFIADGATERRDSGLSTFGFKVIERMNRMWEPPPLLLCRHGVS